MTERNDKNTGQNDIPASDANAIESLTFEEAFEQLQQIVEQIEQGQVGLEEAISRYERGMKLIAHCRRILQQAEQKVLQLQSASDGQVSLEPFEIPPEQSRNGS